MIEYVELHTHSCYSLLDGASTPEVLVGRASALGMQALALTDHNAVYGAVRFLQAAQETGIHSMLGAEMTLSDGQHLTLLVQDAAGWANLCQLITLARHNAPKGSAALPIEALEAHTEGLIALSGCRKGAIPAALLCSNQEQALNTARQYRDWFGREHFYLELQHHLLPGDNRLVAGLAALADEIGVGCVATNNVHYAQRDGQRLQDVLVCIRHNTHTRGILCSVPPKL